MIRAWLVGLVDRVLPLDPDPAGWGQPQMSEHGFLTDSTLRRQPVPPEIEAAGGFGVGLEMAAHARDGHLQPMGPVVVFLVVPMGRDRSEVRIFALLGITMESRKRLVEELRSSWPGEEIYGDEVPWWAGRDFDRRALFKAIATGGPPPLGAPARRRIEDPLPWHDPFATEYWRERFQTKNDQGREGSLSSLAHAKTADPLPPALKGRRREIVNQLRDGRTDVEIAAQLEIDPRSVAKRIVEARRVFGPEIVPHRRPKQTAD